MNVQPSNIERISEYQADEIPVLIAGGGLIGLSLSMFLAQHGIPSLAIEKLRGGSQCGRRPDQPQPPPVHFPAGP
jgi:hypothetical protein